MIGFGFTSNWSRKWHEIFYPITKHSNAKPNQLRNYFGHSIEKAGKAGEGRVRRLFRIHKLGQELDPIPVITLKIDTNTVII